MQLAPGLHAFRQDEGGHVHAFLIDDGTSLTLIDTLFNDDASVIVDELKLIGKQTSDLTSIIITHAHRSHIGGVAALKKASKATVYSHEWEADIISAKRKATPVGIWPKPPLEVYSLQLGLALGLKPHQPCEVDKPLKEGDHIGPLEVLAVPGHTPGCLAFYWHERRAMIVGDIVVTWPHITPGWPGLTLDNDQNLKSVGKMADLSTADILCVGHGEPLMQGASDVLRDLRDGKQPGPPPSMSPTPKSASV
jgi:glyoxylase-like metal-dependent hydrolase (beta-lactamase superfamily II)